MRNAIAKLEGMHLIGNCCLLVVLAIQLLLIVLWAATWTPRRWGGLLVIYVLDVCDLASTIKMWILGCLGLERILKLKPFHVRLNVRRNR